MQCYVEGLVPLQESAAQDLVEHRDGRLLGLWFLGERNLSEAKIREGLNLLKPVLRISEPRRIGRPYLRLPVR